MRRVSGALLAPTHSYVWWRRLHYLPTVGGPLMRRIYRRDVWRGKVRRAWSKRRPTGAR